MVDLMIENGLICTVNEDRAVISDGTVAVDDVEIVDVGPSEEVTPRYDADEVIDAEGHAVLPGFITTHVHVSDILLRGLGNDRDLYDWLFNVKAATAAMEPEDHEIATALYCLEAVQSGITTFVENVTGAGSGFVNGSGPSKVVDTKMDVYDRAGLRNIWAQAVVDRIPAADFTEYYERIAAKEPSAMNVNREDNALDTEAALDGVETLIEEYHATADGRQSVWPAPYEFPLVSPEALQGSYEMAQKYDVMTTTHTATTTAWDPAPNMSDVEYADSCDYLGKRTLLGHCIYVSDRDLRLLAATNTRVAHNVMTNLMLGDGFAPVPEMNARGITVGMGTDNSSASDTVNMINDLRFAASVHKSSSRDAGAITAEKAIEMATIDAARAIGRADDLGSIESGKLADLVLVDLEAAHLTPAPNVADAIVYQAESSDVDTVICNGEILVRDGQASSLDASYSNLLDRATEASERVLEKAGLSHLSGRPWRSVSER